MRRRRKQRNSIAAACDKEDDTQYHPFLGLTLPRLDYKKNEENFMQILETELRYPQYGTDDDSKEIFTIDDILFLHDEIKKIVELFGGGGEEC